MKSGPEPVKGFEAAIPVALRRGRVMQFRSSPAYVSSFMFFGNGLLVLVSLRLARKLFHATLAEIGLEYADAIAGLRTIPCGGPVSRELWLYSRYGALRFFRIREDGSLAEIDREGVPFVDGKPAGPAEPATGAAGPAVPAPAAGLPGDPGSADPPGHILGFLKKWNAMNAQAADGAGVTGTRGPEKIPDSSSRAPEIFGIVSAGGTEPVTGGMPVSGSPAGDRHSGESASSHTPGEEGGGTGG
jgi:hypothetical protein